MRKPLGRNDADVGVQGVEHDDGVVARCPLRRRGYAIHAGQQPEQSNSRRTEGPERRSGHEKSLG
jgi:hypothetical protein